MVNDSSLTLPPCRFLVMDAIKRHVKAIKNDPKKLEACALTLERYWECHLEVLGKIEPDPALDEIHKLLGKAEHHFSQMSGRSRFELNNVLRQSFANSSQANEDIECCEIHVQTTYKDKYGHETVEHRIDRKPVGFGSNLDAKALEEVVKLRQAIERTLFALQRFYVPVRRTDTLAAALAGGCATIWQKYEKPGPLPKEMHAGRRSTKLGNFIEDTFEVYGLTNNGAVAFNTYRASFIGGEPIKSFWFC